LIRLTLTGSLRWLKEEKKLQRKLRKKLRKKRLKKEEEDSNLVIFIKNASHYNLYEKRFFY